MKIELVLNNVSESTSYAVLQPGEYNLIINDTTLKMSKAGNQMIQVEFLHNESGTKLWDYFVLNNDVGKSRLKGLIIAAGHPNPDFIDDTEELHGLSVGAKIEIISNEYGDKNKIKSFFALPNKKQPQPHPQKQTTPQPQKPWEKKEDLTKAPW